MGAVRAALELGVELRTQMEVAAGNFHGLHKVAIGAGAGNDKALLLKLGAERIVELIAVAVALINFGRAVAFGHLGAGGDGAGVLAQPHRAALGLNALLVGHQINDIVLALGGKLAGVGVRVAQHIAGVLHDHDLHTQTDAEVGDMVLPRVLGSLDHPLDAAVAEAAGNDDAVRIAQLIGAAALVHQMLAVHPLDLDLALILKAGVVQALHNAEVGIVQLDILAHQCDGAGLAAGGDAADQLLPLSQIARRGLQVQLAGHNIGKPCGFQHQRALVKARHRQVFNHAVGAHIAEHADLALDVIADRAVGTQHNHIGGNAHALQLLAGVLGRLGLVLIRAGNVGHQHDMDVAAVFKALFQPDLTDGLQEGLALNVAGRAADLGDDNISLGAFGKVVDVALDLVGDVGDDLHGLAQIGTLTLLVQDIPVDLAGGQVGVFVQVFIGKALIMAKVEVGLGAVIRHKDLAVLQGAHRARVHIDIGVQLLAGNLQPARFKQPPQTGRRDALAQTGDNAAGHKNILRCHNSPSIPGTQKRPPYPKKNSFPLYIGKNRFCNKAGVIFNFC